MAWADASSQSRNSCDGEHAKHILWENDVITGKLFGRSDKWYTNGLKFFGSYPAGCVPWDLPESLRNSVDRTVEVGYTMGQLMFTPKNLTTAAPQPMDRFWGGWLYLGLVAQRQPYERGEAKQEGRKLDKSELETLELDVGVTGPISGAEQVQRTIHALTNSTMPAGWSNQIKTEPGIQFNYARIKRFWKHSSDGEAPRLDFSWHYGGSGGTLFDYVNGGFTARLGSKLTDEAPHVIESPSIGQFRTASNACYLLARLDMKGIIHNTFIDGSLFRGEPHASYLNSKRIVPQLSFGGVVERKHRDNEGTRVSILIHRRGSEFRSPAGAGAIFNFATLGVEWDL